MPLSERLSHPTNAAIGLAIGGAMWGIYWVPIRFLAARGLDGAWPGALIYIGALILLAPLIWRARGSIRRNWRQLALCGALTGTAFSLYSTSLMMTEVIRSILLFYLMPLWGTLLGLAFLGEQLSPRRVLALLLGLAGLAAILGVENGVPMPQNLGDLLALASGVVWAVGSFQLYRMPPLAISEQVIAFVTGGLLVTALTLLIGGPDFGLAPGARTLGVTLPWAVLLGVFVLPALYLTIWPVTLLSPARAGLILMTEIVVGVISAALWAGEPFGWQEAAGSCLIVAAALVDLLGQREPA